MAAESSENPSMELAFAAPKRKSDVQIDERTMQQILSMSKDGLSTDKIAKYCSLSPEQVVASLSKRRRTDSARDDDTAEIVVDGDDSETHEDEGVESLVERLMTDPEEFCCPILQSLMENPAMAEDGFTYEQEAIEEALKRRDKSPKTNLPIGPKVILNQGMRTAILNYKERTVEEIMAVAPGIPSGHAQKLLERAGSFVRPLLPDSGARRKLRILLQLQVGLPGLPCVLRGTAVTELLKLLAGNEEDVEGRKVILQNFESWDVRSHLAQCDDTFMAGLQALAQATPGYPCAADLNSDYACRLAARAQEADGAQALWQFVSSLATLEEPCAWVEGAALALACLHDQLQVNLLELDQSLLTQLLDLLRDPEQTAARAKELFKADLLAPDEDHKQRSGRSFSMTKHGTSCRCFLATVLMELARRCVEEPPNREVLMMEAFEADPTNPKIQEALLGPLLESLNSGPLIDKEHVLITLLIAKHGKIPEELLPKLSLEPSQIQLLEPECSMTLARQLAAAKRESKGAEVAVLAAQMYDASGSKEDAQSAYILAYRMDRLNSEASHWVVESCALMSSTCSDLKNIVMEQQTTIEKQRAHITKLESEFEMLQKAIPGRGFAWDISGEDFSQKVKGDMVYSPWMELCKLWVCFVYYPKGSLQARDGQASLFLHSDTKCAMIGELCLDSESKAKTEKSFTKTWGNPNFCSVGQHGKIKAIIRSVLLENNTEMIF